MMTEEFEYYLLYCKTPTEVSVSDGNLVDIRDYTDEAFPDPTQSVCFSIYGKKTDILSYDIHSDGVFYIVSEKIHNAIASLKPQKFQMIPAELMYEGKIKMEGHWFYLNPYHLIKCLNMEESEYDYDDFAKEYEEIEKMVLDNDKLSEVPLAERLIFSLGELYIHRLFHKSVVDAIMAVNPQGVQFTAIADWSIGSAFD